MTPKAQRPSGPETARLIEFARSRAASARACATSPVAIGAGVASLWIAEAATFDAIAAALHAAGPQAPETGEEAAVEDRARGLLRNAVTMIEQGAFVGDNVDRWLTNVYMIRERHAKEQKRIDTAPGMVFYPQAHEDRGYLLDLVTYLTSLVRDPKPLSGAPQSGVAAPGRGEDHGG